MATEVLVLILGAALGALACAVAYLAYRLAEVRALFRAHLDLHDRRDRLYLGELAERARKAGE